MIRWKYMTQQFVTTGLEQESVQQRIHAEMSLMGEYGWELVSTNVYHNTNLGQDVVILFYKKAIDDRVAVTPAPRGTSRPA